VEGPRPHHAALVLLLPLLLRLLLRLLLLLCGVVCQRGEGA